MWPPFDCWLINLDTLIMKKLASWEDYVIFLLTDSTPVNIIIDPLSICQTDALT